MIYRLIIETKQGEIVCGSLDFKRNQRFESSGFVVETVTQVNGGYTRLEISVRGKEKAFITVRAEYDSGELFTFSGKKEKYGVFRQSPHDVWDHVIATPKEAVPMVALYKDSEYTVLFSDNPAKYDNYTVQIVSPEEKYMQISSGDNGKISGGELTFAPYYVQNPRFTVILFKSKATSLLELRKDIFYKIDAAFGEKKLSKFHAICFSSNYMHYRCNEMGSSKCWVVPGIDYCNKQYPRDAFWQSMIFPLEMEQECYDGVYKGRYRYAENALIFLIWSYRLKKKGGRPDEERINDAIEYISAHVKNGTYITGEEEKLAYRSWYDLCSFENDDVVSYNQGLFVVAIMAAKALGINIPFDEKEANKRYNELFNVEKGYFPLSMKKTQILSLDPTVGDLLAYFLFDKKLLKDKNVVAHYRKTFQVSNTVYGAKITCRENGEYCTLDDYSAYGEYDCGLEHATKGDYSWGGSYYLYEMLFHMAAYIHGEKQAEDNMIERSAIDFRVGGTYFEHINTVTGRGNKPNQGWNCCVYPIWQKMIEKGMADERFFLEMEKIL